jgi:hypothetical protein
MNKITTFTAAPAPSHTNFSVRGSQFFPIGQHPHIEASLPPAFYTIENCIERGPHFSLIEPMTLPPKLYGDIEARAERIKNTFATRSRGTTGVMLSGEKGSGKTLLGRKLAIDCCEAGMPVIVLNKPMAGDMLGHMLQSIGVPFVLFIDEFEKIYAKEHQEAMLTVLDGVFTLHMLAILTTNDETRLIDPLLNRPGRIFYRMHYAGLTPEFVREFAADHMHDKSQVDELVRLASLTSLNFDQMGALIEEMNRYGEKLIDAIQFLNVEVDTGDVRFSIEGVEIGGKQYELRDVLTYSFTTDLFDGDPENYRVVCVLEQNVEGLSYKDLSEPKLRSDKLSRGIESGRSYDSRFNQDKYYQCSEEVPTHIPAGFRVIEDCKEAKARPDGLIEARFPTTEGRGDVTILLRRPWSSKTKAF